MDLQTQKRIARHAGWVYFVMALLAVYGGMYVPNKTFVSGDWEATIKLILDNEFFYRSGIAANIISMVLLIYVSIKLHELLRSVNLFQANLMVVLLLLGMAIAFPGSIMKITALKTFHGEILSSFDVQHAHDLAKVYLRYHSYGNKVVIMFWGLWLIPLGILIWQSGFMPRVLGILLFINASGYLIDAFVFILIPDYSAAVSKFTFPLYFAGELPLIFWLMVKGVKTVSTSSI